MLAEFIKSIVGLADQAKRPTVFRAEAEPAHVYLLLGPDGSVDYRHAEAAPRNHIAADLETVARWALRSVKDGEGVSVWYDRTGVTALLDDGTRRDKVTLPLQLSPQILTLQELEKSSARLKQKEFIKLLRVPLAGTLTRHPNLLKSVRSVEFRQAVNGNSDLQQGKSSIGRAIMSQLTGTENIPEEVTLSVPVFLSVVVNPFPIVCALDVDAACETFQLIPLPGEIEASIRSAESKLGAYLRDLLNPEPENEADSGKVALSYGRP